MKQSKMKILMNLHVIETKDKNEWECSLVDQYIVRNVICLCRLSVKYRK